jgi:hypothetical protein
MSRISGLPQVRGVAASRTIPLLLALLLASCASEPALPIASGVYRFQQRFAEQPAMQGTELKATIDGRHIELVNEGEPGVFPHGIVAEGLLLWNVPSRQWIIGTDPTDRHADEVGGCSEGPEVVDLVARIYWTC